MSYNDSTYTALGFERDELQDIRDRAQELAEDRERGAERDALDALAKYADILDALYAREDADIASMEPIININNCPYEPCAPERAPRAAPSSWA